MTEEELKKKAEEYAETTGKKNFKALYDANFSVVPLIELSYKDGYEEGRKEEVKLIFERWCKNNSDPCGILLGLEKENEELKQQIEKIKNCHNCKNARFDWEDNLCNLECRGYDKWELAE